jgi:thiamine kinase-like enzyme
MQDLLDSPLFKHAETGLCHHDPIMANFVGGPDRLYLIDWEYAAKGLLVMDYAALAIEWKIEDNIILTNSGIDPELLTKAKKLYTYLSKLWQQATRNEGSREATIEKRRTTKTKSS